MSNTIISDSHSIKLWNVFDVVNFAIADCKAIMTTAGESISMDIVPGTLLVDDSVSDGIHNKKITFKVRRPDINASTRFENLSRRLFLAEYIDENGNHRISGSLNYPLKFDYVYKGGLFSVTMTGKSDDSDAYIE